MKSHQINCMYNKTFGILWYKSFCLENFTVFVLTPTPSHGQETFFPLHSLPSEWRSRLSMGDRLHKTALGYLIWQFATFHAFSTDSCLLLTSDIIARAFSCKQTASIFTAI